LPFAFAWPQVSLKILMRRTWALILVQNNVFRGLTMSRIRIAVWTVLVLTLFAGLPQGAAWPQRPKEIAWTHAFDLAARRFGEKEFSKDTQVNALEIFKDVNTDNWVFITEKGLVAAAPVRFKTVSSNKPPRWVHSVDLNVRRGGVKEWKDALKVGIEVYYDGN